MVSTFTTNKDIEKPGNGDYVDQWNVPLNGDMTVVDYALGTAQVYNATAGSKTLGSYDHSTKNLVDYSYIPLTIKVTGAISANVTYTVPSGVGGQWIVYNNTTDASGGPWNVTFASGGGGVSVNVPRGIFATIISDGTNIYSIGTTNISGGTTGLTFTAASNVLTLEGTLNVGSGGTGKTSLTANNLLAGNGTGAVNLIPPGANGNILGSDGTSWVSVPPAAQTGGTVTNIATGAGLTGGPITTTGTISLVTTLGAVGTYAMLAYIAASPSILNPGNTTAGGNVAFVSADGTFPVAIVPPSGTWRCMGRASFTGTSPAGSVAVTIFQRIA